MPERILIGGASNAGALFVDWARRNLADLRPHGRVPQPARSGSMLRCSGLAPLPARRAGAVPRPAMRSSIHGLDITTGPIALERAAYEASGFVVRRMVDMSGVTPRRLVVSGGGSRVLPWMAAMADAVGVPADTVAVPEGAALGASFLARMAAGLETQLEGADRWAKVGRRVEPEAEWVKATAPALRALPRVFAVRPCLEPDSPELTMAWLKGQRSPPKGGRKAASRQGSRSCQGARDGCDDFRRERTTSGPSRSKRSYTRSPRVSSGPRMPGSRRSTRFLLLTERPTS